MSSYVLSNSNRFYVAVESQYGQPALINTRNRFPAIRLRAQQVVERTKRVDKTGTRTYRGGSPNGRRNTAFELRGFLSSWSGDGQPVYGPFFQAGLGAIPRLAVGLVVAAVQNTTQLQTTGPHGLSQGMGIAYANEIRFVATVVDDRTFIVNVPFSTQPIPNTLFAPTISYGLAVGLPSLTIFDYWDPGTFLNRAVTGAAVDVLTISVNGDLHEMVFRGPAANLMTAGTFTSPDGSLLSFPPEPNVGTLDYAVVPGHLGQVWLGNSSPQFMSLTEASIQVKNNIDLRGQEFGSLFPRDLTPGSREVSCRFSILVEDDVQSAALYSAAQKRTPMAAMLQLGQQQSQLMGVYVPAVVPEIPSYNDTEPRLEWQFNNNRAQGLAEDEIYVAFA
jgi:hypothetical protein